MVNVHIHQFQGGKAVVYASALAQFQKQWTTYQKLVDSDQLSHKAIGDLPGSALNRVSSDHSRSSILPAAMRA